MPVCSLFCRMSAVSSGHMENIMNKITDANATLVEAANTLQNYQLKLSYAAGLLNRMTNLEAEYKGKVDTIARLMTILRGSVTPSCSKCGETKFVLVEKWFMDFTSGGIHF